MQSECGHQDREHASPTHGCTKAASSVNKQCSHCAVSFMPRTHRNCQAVACSDIGFFLHWPHMATLPRWDMAKKRIKAAKTALKHHAVAASPHRPMHRRAAPPSAVPPCRVGTRSLTAHVLDDLHEAIHELASSEHLTVDETLHLGMALVLRRNGHPLPQSLKLKLKRHRLLSYLPAPAPRS
jgi:hypothetical protein